MEKTNLQIIKTVIQLIPIIVSIGSLFYTIQRTDILSNQLELAEEQIEIMRLSLERRPDLVLTVIPSFLVGLKTNSSGATEVTNSTSVLSRTNNFTFTIAVSNIGDAFAHIMCYDVFSYCPDLYAYSKFSTDTILLEPNGIATFEYIFDPLRNFDSNNLESQ